MREISELQWDNRESGETPLRQMQLVSLRLLRVLDVVAKKVGVQYFIMYGTLLGARRHGAFLPWDDDIDVAMTLEDCQKFLKNAARYLPSDVTLMSVSTEKTWHGAWLKLVDAYSTVGVPSCEERYPQHLGISLDIFCWYYYSQKNPGKIMRHLQDLTFKIAWFYYRRHVRRVKIVVLAWLLSPFHVVLQMFWRMVSFFSRKKGKLGMTPNVGCVDRFVRYDKAKIFPLKMIRFEGFDFPCPCDSDYVLCKRYGENYMIPPPPERRLAHVLESDIHPFTPCAHPRAKKWPEGRKLSVK